MALKRQNKYTLLPPEEKSSLASKTCTGGGTASKNIYLFVCLVLNTPFWLCWEVVVDYDDFCVNRRQHLSKSIKSPWLQWLMGRDKKFAWRTNHQICTAAGSWHKTLLEENIAWRPSNMHSWLKTLFEHCKHQICTADSISWTLQATQNIEHTYILT